MTVSTSDEISSFLRSRGRVASWTKARVAEIIASISSMSRASLACNSSGVASMRNRSRVRGVRRSCAIAAIMLVRYST